MKNNFVGTIILILVLLGSLLTSCGNDIILDTTNLPTTTTPQRSTIVDPTSLPANQSGNTGNEQIGRPPLFVSQAVTRVVENLSYNYEVFADDPDFGDTLKITALKLPSWLELSQNDNSTLLKGKPENKHIGGHLVELVVTDSNGLQSKQVFYVYVIDASSSNNPQTVSSQNLNTREDEELKIVLSPQDLIGDALQYNITKSPNYGELNGSGAQLTYKPNADFSGEDSFSYTASNGNITSEEASINIRVFPVNDFPIAKAGKLIIDKNESIEIILEAEDVETNLLIHSIVSEPNFGTLSTLYGNKVTYTPKANFIGEDSFLFKASDGLFASNTAKITIEIQDSIILPESESEPQSSKYRVLISTDVGLDPDDIQSLYRLVHYSDIFDIEGIIASTGLEGYDPKPEMLKQAIKNIQVDSLRAKGYTKLTDQATLLSRVKVGKSVKGTPVAGASSQGSNHIIQQVKQARESGDTRPLWILVWGPITDVAQALRDEPSIASSIRIFSIGSVNHYGDLQARNYVYNFVKNVNNNLFWIDNSSVGDTGLNTTFIGTYSGGHQAGEWSAHNFVDANIRNHGQAGNLFPLAQPPLKEGDSPSLLYFISPKFGNVGNVDNPTAESWGGRYKLYDSTYPNYFVDCCASQEAARATISKWRQQHLSHWKARWDRYLE